MSALHVVTHATLDRCDGCKRPYLPATAVLRIEGKE